MEKDLQLSALERFQDAILSMEAQLISLYEEKLQNCESNLHASTDSNSSINEFKIAHDELKSERDALLSECLELRNIITDSRAPLASEADLTMLRDANEDLRRSLNEAQLTIIELQRAQHTPTESQNSSPNSSKVFRKNIELTDRNQALEALVEKLTLERDEAFSEIKKLSATNSQEVVTVRKELQEELARVKQELSQSKQKFKEVGALILEKFFDED